MLKYLCHINVTRQVHGEIKLLATIQHSEAPSVRRHSSDIPLVRRPIGMMHQMKILFTASFCPKVSEVSWTSLLTCTFQPPPQQKFG